MLGTVNSTFASQSYLAEQINLLWKVQWESEWREARKKHKKKDNLKTYQKISVDLQSMSKYDVSGFTKKSSNLKKKMYKQKKNQFTLGFDVGFTKQLSLVNNLHQLDAI